VKVSADSHFGGRVIATASDAATGRVRSFAVLSLEAVYKSCSNGSWLDELGEKSSLFTLVSCTVTGAVSAMVFTFGVELLAASVFPASVDVVSVALS